jgi:hypothetical protein
LGIERLDLLFAEFHPIVIVAASQGQFAGIFGNLLNPGHKSTPPSADAPGGGEEQGKKTPSWFAGKI